MTDFVPNASSLAYAGGMALAFVLACIIINVLWLQLPRPKSEPPVVFHWLPFVGNAISYGMNPFNFYSRCRENPLTTPVFGSDIIYDCPNSKLMEQKKFVKFGLTQKALDSYVPLIEKEVIDYIQSAPALQGNRGTVNISQAMAEITIFTAGRSLQGAEVRKKLTGEFAELYHDLDLGFRPINFLMPWAPLPQNRRRDLAHGRMRDIYTELINERRKASGFEEEDDEEEADMIRNLMQCVYKNGRALPDKEIAHMMITLLMAGQHSSSSSSAWIMLRLASRPDIAEELYQELKQQGFGPTHRLQYADLDKLQLLSNVVQETLRVHSSIHSIMRKVKQPMRVPDSDYVITPDKVLVASPLMTHLNEGYFRNALTWDPHRWDNEVEAEEDEVVDYGYGATSKGTKSPYLPFGAGRHRCIGEKFAYLNLATIISTLVRHFKFATLDGKAVVPPTDYTSLFSRPTQPAVVRWERRECSAA
ncbi:Eburicol 14-alpha-demethylase [Beauveria bassiana]|nr:Eburicol 14-alpha-demethylase [Beauveria bassiana]